MTLIYPYFWRRVLILSLAACGGVLNALGWHIMGVVFLAGAVKALDELVERIENVN